MKKIIYLILPFILLISCNYFYQKDLQLDGPTIEEAEYINKTTDSYVDGFYLPSKKETGLEYTITYDMSKSYHVAYKPVITARDFKNLNSEMSSIGRPLINVNLHEDAHQRWADATQTAYEEDTPIFVIIDGNIVSAPTVANGPITGGRTQISGEFKEQEVLDIINGITKRNSKSKK